MVALFELQVELDNVEVRDELLNLAVPALVHLKDRVEAHHDLLLEDELGPVPFSVLLVRKISKQHANLDLILRRNLLNQVHGDLLSHFLSAEHILQDSVESDDEELNCWCLGSVWRFQHLNQVEVERHGLLIDPLTYFVHAEGLEQLFHVGTHALLNRFDDRVATLIED